MADLILAIGVLGFAIAGCVLVLEIYNEARRAWFFYRTRRHVEKQWREWAEAQERRKG